MGIACLIFGAIAPCLFPFGRITGIRLYGYNLSPCVEGTPNCGQS